VGEYLARGKIKNLIGGDTTVGASNPGGIVLFVQISALEVENVNQIKYEGTPHFPVTASSAKIGFSESI